MKKFNVAIIGLGKIGLGYDLADSSGVRSHTKAFLNNHHYHLAMGVDPSTEMRNEFEYFSNAKSYENIDKVPEDVADQIDILVIATPSITRVQDCESLLNKFLNISYVVLEKPVALTLEEATKLRVLLERRNLQDKVFVNYMRRCNHDFINLRDRIHAEEWGKINKIELKYSGDLINMGSHFIDLANFFFNLNFVVTEKSFFQQNSNNDFCANAKLELGGVSFSIITSPKIEMLLSFEHEKINILDSGNKILIGDKVTNVDLSHYQEIVVEHLTDILLNNAISLSDFNTAKNALVVCENIRRF